MVASFGTRSAPPPQCSRASRIAVLICCIAAGGVRGLEHYLANAALSDLQCRAVALAEQDGSPVSKAIDGTLATGWSWGTELDNAEAIFILNHMHTLTGIRVYSGHLMANGGPSVSMGGLITRFRLWYTTSVPENISDPLFFTGGWGMSHGQWRSVPFLRAESEDDSSVAVLDDIILTARADTMLQFPPLLVRALRIVVEDTHSEEIPAVLNEFQAIAPRHLNPGLDAPHLIQRPARGYIWPLYNASDVWRSTTGACRCHEPVDAREEMHGISHDGRDLSDLGSLPEDGARLEPTPWFSWEGALEHNESLVRGTLVAHVHVHGFGIPEQGQLELYVQNTRAAWTDEDTNIRLSIAELSDGLHIFTARLRGRDGVWLPFSDRRVVFVGGSSPAHPWLLAHDIQVVGDGLSSARVGERALFRIHIMRSNGADGEGPTRDAQGSAGETQGGSVDVVWQADDTTSDDASDPSSRQSVIPELNPTWLQHSEEHWTVELRGPAIIPGYVVQNSAVPGVYDVSYTVYDPGEYFLSIVLHYVSGHGLRDPGVGGQEDVVEHLVEGSPFRVWAAASDLNVCRTTPVPAIRSNSISGTENVSLWVLDGAINDRDDPDLLPLFHPRRPRPLCTGMQATNSPGRWINRRVFCGRPACQHSALSPGYWSHCDFADEHDDWIWAPLECSLRRHSPLEAQTCLEDSGRRVLVAGASPQRTLFFDVADIVLPGDVVTSKAHQDLEFPPSAFFHWIPYHTNSVPGCPLDCQLDYDNVTWHIENYVNHTSGSQGDVLVVQAGIHDIFFGSLDTYFRNIPKLAAILSRLHHTRRLRVLFRIGDMIHLPRGGDVALVEHGFRSQRMIAALELARRVMIEADVPILDTLQLTVSRPEGTADGYHFNEWACLEDTYRGNAISRATAHIVMQYACDESTIG